MPYVDWVSLPTRNPGQRPGDESSLACRACLPPAKRLTAASAAARSVELDSSQKRECSWWRKATLLLLTRTLELLSGLETEQGRCQSQEGPFAYKFPIHRENRRGKQPYI